MKAVWSLIVIAALAAGLYVVVASGKFSFFQDSLKEKIKSKCISKDSALVKMKDYTWFEWDTMYVFNQRASNKLIKKLTNVDKKENYTCHQMYFRYKGKTVYFEEQRYDSSDRESGTLNFDIYNVRDGYLIFTPETAVFRFVTTHIGSFVYYDLDPVYINKDSLP